MSSNAGHPAWPQPPAAAACSAEAANPNLATSRLTSAADSIRSLDHTERCTSCASSMASRAASTAAGLGPSRCLAEAEDEDEAEDDEEGDRDTVLERAAAAVCFNSFAAASALAPKGVWPASAAKGFGPAEAGQAPKGVLPAVAAKGLGPAEAGPAPASTSMPAVAAGEGLAEAAG